MLTPLVVDGIMQAAPGQGQASLSRDFVKPSAVFQDQ
jgi:hypothetical protein